MSSKIRHIALFVPDLRQAEAYYQNLFHMELICREAIGTDGLWCQLPPDKGWEDADAAGIELSMIGLQHGDLILAFFPGDLQPGQIFSIGLAMSLEEMAAIRSRLPEPTEILENQSETLIFRDRYLITWQIVKSSLFRGNGETQGRWLDV